MPGPYSREVKKVEELDRESQEEAGSGAQEQCGEKAPLTLRLLPAYNEAGRKRARDGRAAPSESSPARLSVMIRQQHPAPHIMPSFLAWLEEHRGELDALVLDVD